MKKLVPIDHDPVHGTTTIDLSGILPTLKVGDTFTINVKTGIITVTKKPRPRTDRDGSPDSPLRSP
jgi:hypothetical protein